MTIKRQVCYIKCSKPKLKKTPMFRDIITRRIHSMTLNPITLVLTNRNQREMTPNVLP